MVLHRIALPLLNSFLITAALFGFMYSLIYTKDPELSASLKLPIVDFVYVPKTTTLNVVSIKPERPELVKERPEMKRIVDIESESIESVIGQQDQFPIDRVVSLVPTDNQLVIALGFPPEYPNRAIQRKIEGFVVVGFSVSAAGEVFDAYIQEAEPKGVFEKSALKAISKFKYRARSEGGKPVATTGQRYMFTYKLED